MKAPEECESLQDVRAEIDRIDRDVIAALGRRFAYVKAAAKFKTGEAGVKAADRFAAMLQHRREWASA
jgi:isochorismate pyruvate lyase